MKHLVLLVSIALSAAAQTATFPSAVVTDAQLRIARNRVATTLRASASASDTVLTVADASKIVANMLLTIDAEVVNVSSVSGNNLTVVRGYDGTTAATHALGRAVSAYWTAWHHNAMAAEVKAIETALGAGLSNISGDGTAQYYSSTYDFAPQAPGGTLTASVVNVVTLTPCPKGVAGTNTQHYLYVSGGTGTAEAVKITGGTCTSEAATGTITFTPAYDHSGAWTIASASAGIKEASVYLGGTGAIRLPGGRIDIYGTIVLPTRISLTGQGDGSSATNYGTILWWLGGSGPALIVADDPWAGLFPGFEGIGVHRGYAIYSPNGTGDGLWIGGDPAGVLTPATWQGNYTRFEDFRIWGFVNALVIQFGNFVSFHSSTFDGSSRALLIPSTADGLQYIEFSDCVLTVPTGNAVQMDASSYRTASMGFYGGQVSGTITGTAVDWQSFGTHYEPNVAGAAIVDIDATGGSVRITGGLLGTHSVTSCQLCFRDGGEYWVSLRDVFVQDSGVTIPVVVLFASTGGQLRIDNVTMFSSPFGYTTLYDLTGSYLANVSVDMPWYSGSTSIAAAASLAFPVGNYPVRGLTKITGATLGGGITAVSGLIDGQFGKIHTDNPQSFVAGASIGNTITTVAGVPVSYYFDGTKIWFSTTGGGGGGGDVYLAGPNAFLGKNSETPTANQDITAASTITCAANVSQVTPAADIVLTSTPHIATGVVGQLCVIHNLSATYAVTFRDASEIASGLRLVGGTSYTVRPRNSISLRYNSTLGWVQEGAHPITKGTALPTSGTCDSEAEAGNFYIQTGAAASVPSIVWVCNGGGAAWAWEKANIRSGLTPPAVCVVGELFFKTDNVAGQNILGCTATDTWTQQAGGGGTQTEYREFRVLCQNTVAGSNFSLPASGAPTQTCVTGTNTLFGQLDFADTATQTVHFHTILPAGYTAIAFDGFWKSGVGDAGLNAVWQLQLACAANDESGDPAWDTARAYTEANLATANRVNTIASQTLTLPAACAAGEVLFGKLFRDPTHASDTLAATASLVFARLKITR